MDHHEDIPEEQESKLKKIIVIIMGLFLIILFLSYYLVDYNTASIIAGQFTSATIKDNIVSFKNGQRIIFQDDTYEQLKDIYFENLQHEFKACLFGEKQDKDYIVHDIFLPTIHYQDIRRVVATPCPEETIVSLHSHPFKRCIFSETDVNSFKHLQRTNKDAIIALMCEQDRFAIYTG